MTLHELLNIIASSKPEDWNYFPCWGANSGPSYHNRFTSYNKREDQSHVLLTASQSEVASYKPDVSITIAWGLTADDDLQMAWANKLADPKATSHLVDVFYNNALVYRDYYVRIGHETPYLPMTRTQDDLRVAQGYYSFIKIVSSFHSSEFEKYFHLAGLKLTDDMSCPQKLVQF